MTWTLSASRQDARVYVQFRDAAGNVSDGPITDSIRYTP